MTFTTKTARWFAAAVAIATATTVSACGSNDGSTNATAAQTQQQDGPQGTTPGGRRGGFPFDTAALAKELGVSESKLEAAIEASRPEDGARPTTPTDGERPTTPPQGGQPGQGMSDMFASIAKELGLSESKVQQAFEAVLPRGGMGGPPNGGQGGPGNGQAPPDGAQPQAQDSGTTTAS